MEDGKVISSLFHYFLLDISIQIKEEKKIKKKINKSSTIKYIINLR